MNEKVAKIADAAIILTVLGFALWGIITLAEFVKLEFSREPEPKAEEPCVEIDRGRPEDIRIVSEKAGKDHYQLFMTASGEVVVYKCDT